MRPLIIDNEVKKKLHNLKEFAWSNAFALNDLNEIIAGRAPCAGDRQGFSRLLSFGYRIVFTIEEHPAGWMAHLSMSVPVKGKFPNPEAVAEICTILGFEKKINENISYVDDKENCINILEQIKK